MSPSYQKSIFRLCQPSQKIWWEHSNAILSSLAEKNIDVAFVGGQAYDHFITAMSSEACSVQGRKKRIAPVALRTYCNSHVLNLSIGICSQAQGKDVPEVYPLRVKSMSTVGGAKKTGVE